VTAQPSFLARVTSAVAGALVLAVAALALASPASAGTPCAEAILADWLDNTRIDRIYDLPCYEQAIDAIPSDLLPYSDAEEVIGRAFQSAAGRRLEKRELAGPRSPTPPSVVPPVNTSASTAPPIPLLVLGGMSVVLLAAGGLGYVARRRRG